MNPSGWQLLGAAPWIVAAVLLPLLLARRSRIRRFPRPAPAEAPFVSIIVPARNESENIGACISTLLNTEYPRFEVIVVDDQSADGTADIVRLIAARSNGRLRLIEGQAPPAGWIGKSWACWQGYQAAQGELLLFTDADTRHDEALLGHAVGGLLATGAGLLTVLPRQRMLTFWERVVLPQIFATIILRYHDVESVSRSRRPQHVIANGQYLLFRREAYDAIGGHQAVGDDVVEDLAFAQRIVESGRKLQLNHADDMMDTRMYRTLGGIMEGWTKNLALGSRRAVPHWFAPAVPWLLGLLGLAFWTAPAVLLVLSFFTDFGDPLRGWAFLVVVSSALLWMLVYIGMRIPPQHALLFPLAGCIVALLFFRSAWRGGRVEWRGRRYG